MVWRVSYGVMLMDQVEVDLAVTMVMSIVVLNLVLVVVGLALVGICFVYG